jgi:hypothetical protein
MWRSGAEYGRDLLVTRGLQAAPPENEQQRVGEHLTVPRLTASRYGRFHHPSAFPPDGGRVVPVQLVLLAAPTARPTFFVTSRGPPEIAYASERVREAVTSSLTLRTGTKRRRLAARLLFLRIDGPLDHAARGGSLWKT